MIFKPAAREPVDPRAVFILLASVFAGCLAIALGAAPSSLGIVLPDWGVKAWSVTVVVGSVLTLAGMAKQGLYGVVTEQVGSAVVCGSTLMYSWIAFEHVGRDALQSVGIVSAWGLACGLRWIQLALLVREARLERGRQELLARIQRLDGADD